MNGPTEMDSLLAIYGFFIDIMLNLAWQNANGGDKLCYPNSCTKMNFSTTPFMKEQDFLHNQKGLWLSFERSVEAYVNGDWVMDINLYFHINGQDNASANWNWYFVEHIISQEYRFMLIPTFMFSLLMNKSQYYISSWRAVTLIFTVCMTWVQVRLHCQT